jgi:hypothetical protein
MSDGSPIRLLGPNATSESGEEPDKTFAPIAPTTYVPPTRIAADTSVIHQVQPALGQPLFVDLS